MAIIKVLIIEKIPDEAQKISQALKNESILSIVTESVETKIPAKSSIGRYVSPFETDILFSENDYLERSSGNKNYDIVLFGVGETQKEDMEAIKMVVKRNAIPVVVLIDEKSKDLYVEITQAGAIDCVLKRDGYLNALPLIVKKAFEIYGYFQRMKNLDNKLQSTLGELETAYRDINNELEIAQNIQAAMIPHKFPETKGLKIYSSFIPNGKIGGDLFDVMQLDDNQIIFYILDVSGHGVPSALISAMAKMSFTNHLQSSDSLALALENINNEMIKNIPREYYLTTFIGKLNLDTYDLKYANASHTSPFLFRKRLNSIETLSGDGLFVGMIEENTYNERTIRLENGDKIFLFTDGIYEIYTGKREIYGKDRLKNLFFENIDLDGSLIIEKIMADQKKYIHAGVYEDDVSAMIIEVKEPSRLENLLLELGFEKDLPAEIVTFRHANEIDIKISNICRKMAQYGFGDADIKRMRLILVDLIIAAFNFEIKNYTSNKIIIGYFIKPKEIKIGVLNENRNFTFFNKEMVSNQNTSEEIRQIIYLVKSYADKIDINNTGNRINIVKKIQDVL